MSENIMSVCQYVRMSICQHVSMSICQNATFQLMYQNESCSECHQDVNMSLLICHYVRMQLFSLGINMKVFQNVIMMSEHFSQKSCSECHHDVRTF